MRFVVVRPTHAVSALPGVFNQALDMIEAALTSSDFVKLFFDLCGAFAVALQFQWNEADARGQWTTWTTAHPVRVEWLTINIDGGTLIDKFGQYDVGTRRITLDTSFLTHDALVPDQDYGTKAAYLLLVKGLHEVADSLTKLILSFLKHVYRAIPQAPTYSDEEHTNQDRKTVSKEGRLRRSTGAAACEQHALQFSSSPLLSFHR